VQVVVFLAMPTPRKQCDGVPDMVLGVSQIPLLGVPDDET
jgi:hypothetical protein